MSEYRSSGLSLGSDARHRGIDEKSLSRLSREENRESDSSVVECAGVLLRFLAFRF